MDFSTSTVAAPATPAPRPIADMRPTADAAATARITKPELPVAMPTPPATSQVAEVSRSMLGAGVDADSSTKIAPVAMIERTLKPYGISMLPKSAEQAADAARTQNAAKQVKDRAPRETEAASS
jgi:hypothetical protein